MKNSYQLVGLTLLSALVIAFQPASATPSAPADAAPSATPARPLLYAVPAPAASSHGAVAAVPEIPYATVWADDKGQTHVGTCALKGLKLISYAPPAAPEWLGIAPDDIDSVTYNVLPVGYVGQWHHAPGPQWVITLSGKWSVETTDGHTLVQGPGDFQFGADAEAYASTPDGKVGHITRTVGSEPNVHVIIRLKKKPNQTYVNQQCAL
jgi:hypothetical protein